MLHLQVSDTTGYTLLIQPSTALSCYQAAPGMQLPKANTIEIANREARRSFCYFENPSIQNPILLFATSLFWNPKVIFHFLLPLLLLLSSFWSLHSNSTADLLFSKAQRWCFVLLRPTATVKLLSSFTLKTNKQTNPPNKTPTNPGEIK